MAPLCLVCLCLKTAPLVVLVPLHTKKATLMFVCVFPPSGSSRRRRSTRNSHNAKPRRYSRSVPYPCHSHTCSHLVSIIGTAANASCLSRKNDAQHFTNTLFNTHSLPHYPAANITARLPALPLAGKQKHVTTSAHPHVMLFVMLNHRSGCERCLPPSFSLAHKP